MADAGKSVAQYQFTSHKATDALGRYLQSEADHCVFPRVFCAVLQLVDDVFTLDGLPLGQQTFQETRQYRIIGVRMPVLRWALYAEDVMKNQLSVPGRQPACMQASEDSS